MELLFLHVFACSMCCITIYAACLPGNLLSPFVNLVNRFTTHPILEYLKNPLWDCLSCMCSFWGVIYYWINFGLPGWDIVNFWPVIRFVLMVGAVNFIIDLLQGIIEIIKK